MEKLESYNNNDVYEVKYQKIKIRVFIFAFILLLGILISFLSFYWIISVLIAGEIDFNAKDIYLLFLFSIMLIYVSVRQLVVYYGNKITISNSFISIVRADKGKIYKIYKKSIIAKKKAVTFNRDRRSLFYRFLGFSPFTIGFISIFLKNGKMINTGPLNCSEEDLEKISKEFSCKEITGMKPWKKQVSDLIDYNTDDGYFIKKTNGFFPKITLFSVTSLVIGLFLLLSGFNEVIGIQESFHLSGKVVHMTIDKPIRKGIGSKVEYKIEVLDDITHKKYDIEVNSNLYAQYNLNNKITIDGKRGSLGILYDIYYS